MPTLQDLADFMNSVSGAQAPGSTDVGVKSGDALTISPALPATLKRGAQDVGIGMADAVSTDPINMYGIGQTMVAIARRQQLSQATLSDEGFQNVEDDKSNFIDQFHANNPDASSQQAEQQYDKYQQTPQYQQFLAQQPTHSGLALADYVHKAISSGAGLPVEQQTPDDRVLQSVVSAASPSPLPLSAVVKPALTVAKVGGKTAGIVEHVADALSGAGTPVLKYTPQAALTNAAVDAGLQAALMPSQQTSAPVVPQPQNEPPASVGPNVPENLTAPINVAPPPAQPKAVAKSGPVTINPIGTAEASTPQSQSGATDASQSTLGFAAAHPLLVGGGLATALAALTPVGRSIRRMVRPSNLNSVDFAAQTGQAGQGQLEKFSANRYVKGFAQDERIASNPVSGAAQAAGQAVDHTAPLLNLARQLGGAKGLVEVRGTFGTASTPQSARQAFQRFFTSGHLPDGTVSPVALEEHMLHVQQLSPQQLELYNNGIVAHNIAEARHEALQVAIGEQADAQAAHATRPTVLTQRKLDDANARVTGSLADDPNYRGNAAPNLSNQQALDAVAAMNADPGVMAVVQQRRQINAALNRSQRRAGLITQKQYASRMQNLDYTPLFEFRGNTLQELPRDKLVPTMGTGGIERFADPSATIIGSAATVTKDVQKNIGDNQTIAALKRMDPTGEQVRTVGYKDTASYHAPFGNEGIVTTYVAGRPYATQFAQQAVARAFRADDIGFEGAWKLANNVRKIAQTFITGVASPAAPAVAAKSAIYDSFVIGMTHRADTAYGYLDLLGQIAAHKSGIPGAVPVARAIGRLDPTGHIATAFMPARLAFEKSTLDIANRVLNAHIANSAWWRAAQTSGLDAPLTGLANVVTKAYANSVTSMLERSGFAGSHAMVTDVWGAGNQIEKLMQKYANGGTNASFAGQVLDAYKAGLESIHGAALAVHAEHTRMLRVAQLGRPLNEAEERQIAAIAHTSIGDFTAMPAGDSTLSAGYKGLAAAVPYYRISIATARNVLSSMFMEGGQQSLNTFLGASTVAGLMYANYKMFEAMGPQALDWYWNKRSWLERVGSLYIPTDRIEHFIQNGSWGPFDLANPTAGLSRVAIAPEMTLLTAPIVAGLEQLGVMQRPSGPATGSPLRDLGAVAAENFVPAGPALLNNVLSIAGGGQVDLTKPFTEGGRSAVSEGPSARNKSLGLQQGSSINGMPNYVANILNGVFGIVGQTVSQSLDAGLAAYKNGQDADTALKNQELIIKQASVGKLPDVPFLWKADDKIATNNPTSQVVFDAKNSLQFLNDQLADDFSRKSVMFTNSPSLRGTGLQGLAQLTKRLYGSMLKYPTQQLAQRQNAVQNYQNGRWKLSAGELDNYNETLNKLKADVQNAQSVLYSRIIDINQRIGSSQYGPMLKQAGQPVDINGVTNLLRSKLQDRPG